MQNSQNPQMSNGVEPTYPNGLPQNQYMPNPPPPPQSYAPASQPSQEKPRADVKATLLNLGIIFALVSVYTSFLSFCFDLINKVFPDALDSYSYYYSLSWQDSAIRWSMAVLLVGVPVYLVLSWLANKHVESLAANYARTGRGKTGGRKVLGSIIIFLASATVISDLVVFVYYFFGGEIPTRFVLKIGMTLITAGAILWYYLYDIKRDPAVPALGPKVGAIAIVAATLIAIITGFVVIGSPLQARYQKLDATRISNLQSIVNGVGSFWQSKYVLPQKLDELTYFSGRIPVDPETSKAYDYRIVDERHFSVCAVFDTSVPKAQGNSQPYYYGYSTMGITDWSHDVGEKCFEAYLDPSVYQSKTPVTPPMSVPAVIKPYK